MCVRESLCLQCTEIVKPPRAFNEVLYVCGLWVYGSFFHTKSFVCVQSPRVFYMRLLRNENVRFISIFGAGGASFGMKICWIELKCIGIPLLWIQQYKQIYMKWSHIRYYTITNSFTRLLSCLISLHTPLHSIS